MYLWKILSFVLGIFPVIYLTYQLCKKNKELNNSYVVLYAMGCVLILLPIFNPTSIKFGDLELKREVEKLSDSISRLVVLELPSYDMSRRKGKKEFSNKFTVLKNTFESEVLQLDKIDYYHREIYFYLDKKPLVITALGDKGSTYLLTYEKKKGKYYFRVNWSGGLGDNNKYLQENIIIEAIFE